MNTKNKANSLKSWITTFKQVVEHTYKYNVVIIKKSEYDVVKL